MSKQRLSVLIAVLFSMMVLTALTCGAEQTAEVNSHLKQGWNWYKESKEIKKVEEPQKQPEPEPEMEVIKAPESKAKPKEKEDDDQNYNHSTEDFRYPLTEEAKRVPVLAAWLQNPTEENARKWMQWQAKYMEHTSKIGWSLRFAYLNHGDTDYRLPGYSSTPMGAAISSRKQNTAYKNVFESVRDKVSLFFFYKKGCEFCEAEISPLRIFAERYNMKIYGVVQMPEDVEKTLPFKTFVSPQMYYKYSITSVPTLGALYAKEKKFQVIANGYTPTDNIELNLRSFLYQSGIIDQSEFIRLWRAEDTAVLQKLINKAQQKVGGQSIPTTISSDMGSMPIGGM